MNSLAQVLILVAAAFWAWQTTKLILAIVDIARTIHRNAVRRSEDKS